MAPLRQGAAPSPLGFLPAVTGCPTFGGALAGEEARAQICTRWTCAGKRIAPLTRINSAQETLMKTCVPGPGLRLGPETRVTLTPSPCPSCTMCDNPPQMVTDRGRAIPPGPCGLRGRPWAYSTPMVQYNKAGRLSPTHRLGHLAPGAAPQLHALKGPGGGGGVSVAGLSPGRTGVPPAETPAEARGPTD